MIDKKPFEQLIDKLKDEGKYRVFNDILRERGEYPNAIWYGKYNIKNIVNWCSNDYLGMGQHKVVLDAMHTALDQTGAGSGGTRNIGGTSHYHVALEHELAQLHSKESALLFTSAYVANEWTIVSLKRIIPDIVFLSDSKNHASLIQGIRHSGAEKKIFPHNDLETLEQLLRDVKGTPCIVFESVYSMDGYVSKIPEICALAKKYNAITYLDEVHAVGLYGDTGAGYAEKLGCLNEIDILNGTLGKAFGVQGGYITGNSTVIDAIRSVASGFIFTTSLSPVVCAGALASIKYLKDHNDLREKHQQRALQLKTEFLNEGIDVLENNTHIVPVMVRDAKKTKAMSDMLLDDYNIYCQPINYPTVEEGTERLRFAPTPYHSDAMIHNLVDSMRKVNKRFQEGCV
jgi:5-aminolevulinate synthase